MINRVNCQRLQVAANLQRFVDEDVLPGSGIEREAFWAGFDALVHDLAPQNRALLAERDALQVQLDTWHREHPGPISDMPAYRHFLESIGYLLPQPDSVQASTANVIVGKYLTWQRLKPARSQPEPRLYCIFQNFRRGANQSRAHTLRTTHRLAQKWPLNHCLLP